MLKGVVKIVSFCLKKRDGSLSCFGNLLYFNDFLFQKVFGVFNFGHFFCPFFENPKKS